MRRKSTSLMRPERRRQLPLGAVADACGHLREFFTSVACYAGSTFCNRPRADCPGIDDRVALIGILLLSKIGIAWAYLPRQLGCDSRIIRSLRIRHERWAGIHWWFLSLAPSSVGGMSSGFVGRAKALDHVSP